MQDQEQAISLLKTISEGQDEDQTTFVATEVAQDQEQDDLQTISSKLTIQRSLEYYNIPGPYIYSNDLKQRIVAAVQKQQVNSMFLIILLQALMIWFVNHLALNLTQLQLQQT
ncbi:MAG: hypothetical protein EZS28_045841, partial [Streblomastix strix]